MIEFTYFTIADPLDVTDNLNALAMIVGSGSLYSSGASSVMGGAIIFGVLFNVFMTLLKAPMEMARIGSSGLGGGLVGSALFIFIALVGLQTKTRLNVEQITTGQVSVVDNVPIILSFPLAQISSFFMATSEDMRTVYSTVNGSDVLDTDYMAPLRMLYVVRAAGYNAKHLNATLENFIPACIGPDEATIDRLLTSTNGVRAELSSLSVSGSVSVYLDASGNAKSESELVSCNTARDRLVKALDGVAAGTYVDNPLADMGSLAGKTGIVKGVPGGTVEPIGNADVDTAMSDVFAGMASLGEQKVNMYVMDSLPVAAKCAGYAADSYQYEQCKTSTRQELVGSAAFADAVTAFNFDAAAQGGMFTRFAKQFIGVLVAIFILSLPLVMAYAAFYGLQSFGFLAKYFIFGIWIHSWVPIAQIVQFQLDRKLESLMELYTIGGVISVAELPSAFAKMSDYIGTASDVLAATPMIALAILTGSFFSLQGLAARFSSADKFDETAAAGGKLLEKKNPILQDASDPRMTYSNMDKEYGVSITDGNLGAVKMTIAGSQWAKNTSVAATSSEQMQTEIAAKKAMENAEAKVATTAESFTKSFITATSNTDSHGLVHTLNSVAGDSISVDSRVANQIKASSSERDEAVNMVNAALRLQAGGIFAGAKRAALAQGKSEKEANRDGIKEVRKFLSSNAAARVIEGIFEAKGISIDGELAKRYADSVAKGFEESANRDESATTRQMSDLSDIMSSKNENVWAQNNVSSDDFRKLTQASNQVQNSYKESQEASDRYQKARQNRAESTVSFDSFLKSAQNNGATANALATMMRKDMDAGDTIKAGAEALPGTKNRMALYAAGLFLRAQGGNMESMRKLSKVLTDAGMVGGENMKSPANADDISKENLEAPEKFSDAGQQGEQTKGMVQNVLSQEPSRFSEDASVRSHHAARNDAVNRRAGVIKDRVADMEGKIQDDLKQTPLGRAGNDISEMLRGLIDDYGDELLIAGAGAAAAGGGYAISKWLKSRGSNVADLKELPAPERKRLMSPEQFEASRGGQLAKTAEEALEKGDKKSLGMLAKAGEKLKSIVGEEAYEKLSKIGAQRIAKSGLAKLAAGIVSGPIGMAIAAVSTALDLYDVYQMAADDGPENEGKAVPDESTAKPEVARPSGAGLPRINNAGEWAAPAFGPGAAPVTPRSEGVAPAASGTGMAPATSRAEGGVPATDAGMAPATSRAEGGAPAASDQAAAMASAIDEAFQRNMPLMEQTMERIVTRQNTGMVGNDNGGSGGVGTMLAMEEIREKMDSQDRSSGEGEKKE